MTALREARRRRRIRRIFLILLPALALLVATAAWAAPPTNDRYLWTQWWMGATFVEEKLDGQGFPNGVTLEHPGVDAFGAWSSSRGAGVTVAVIDSGVQADHPDLAANVVPGYDFVEGDTDAQDRSGHGTAVAGVIAAVANNGIGVAGVAPEAKVMPVYGGRSSVDSSVDWACRQPGVRVVNASWSSTGESQALREAIAACGARGVLFVASSGNDARDVDVTPNWPAAYDGLNVVAVAATDKTGGLADYSNYGVRTIELAAPSGGMTTARNSKWSTFGGTSMSAPVVSAVAALCFSAYPQATPAQVRRALLVSAQRLPELDGKVMSGLVSAPGALAAMNAPDVGPPAAFRLLAPGYQVKIPSRRAVTVRWQPSADAELAGYRLYVNGKLRLTLPATATQARLPLPRGKTRLRVVAFDLSDNQTTAGR